MNDRSFGQEKAEMITIDSILGDESDVQPEVSGRLGNERSDDPLSRTTHFKCIERLLHSEFTPLERAIQVAAIFRARDPELFMSTFASVCASVDAGEHLFRALEIVENLEYCERFISWLQTLTETAHPRVKSKAAKLLCKAVPKKLLIEQQMCSDDSRVRANAIEALWFHQSPEAATIFRNALSDPCHRVVVNALVGLHYQNDDTALSKLIALSQHPSAMFRAAAVWAFGQIYDDRAIAPLTALANDSSEVVRGKAANTLAKLLYVHDWVPSSFPKRNSSCQPEASRAE